MLLSWLIAYYYIDVSIKLSILVEMKYSGTKKIGDSLAGIHCQLYFDGELHDAMDWAKVRLNPVMLSALFAAPVDVSITGLAL